VEAECTLPASAFRLSDLPELLPPYLRAQLRPVDQQLLGQSKVGLVVDAPTKVSILLSPVGAETPAQKGVQAGFWGQVGQIILAVVAVVWGVLCALVPFKAKAAAAPQEHEQPLILSIIPSHTLKGTLNGVPAWLAHQEIKGLSWDATGQGTLTGNLKLFNGLSLPGLQSALMPSCLRLVVPKLNLRVAQQVANGLNAWPGASEHVQVLETKDHGLNFVFSSQSQALGPFAGHGLHLKPESLNIAADGAGATAEAAVVATFSGAAPYLKPLRLTGNLAVEGDLHGGALNVERPLAVQASLGIAHQGTTEKIFAPVDVLRLSAKYDGQNLSASVTGGTVARDTDKPGIELAVRQAVAARSRFELARPIAGASLAASWASAHHYSLSVDTGDHVGEPDVGEAYVARLLFGASAPGVASVTEAAPEAASDDDVWWDARSQLSDDDDASTAVASSASGSELSTPTLVGDGDSLGTPPLLTLDEAKLGAHDGWSQELFQRFAAP
jgi:hypothetical protein